MANTPRHGERMGDAMEKAKNVAGNVADKARDMTRQANDAAASATDQAHNVMQRASDVASDLGQRAGEAVSSVGGQMRTLADTIRQNVPHEGMMGQAASAIAGTLESGGQYLEGHDLGELMDDMSAVIRRYPVAAVMAGVGFGFLLGRTLRS